MSRCRTVEPEIERLALSDGDFIDIKKRLNHGEQEDLFARMSPLQTPGEKIRLDSREVRTAKVLVYLVGWSLIDKALKPIPMSPDLPESVRLSAIRSVDPESFTEMHDAIRAHEVKVAIRKNDQVGAQK